MEMIVCPNCNKLTGFKRVIGFGTFFAVLFTFGFWLFTIPFYPKRCITCGLTKSASVPWYQTWRVVVLALFVVVLLVGVFQPGQTSTDPAALSKTINPVKPMNARPKQYSSDNIPDIPSETRQQKIKDLLSRQQRIDTLIDVAERSIRAGLPPGHPFYTSPETLNKLIAQREEVSQTLADEEREGKDNWRPALQAHEVSSASAIDSEMTSSSSSAANITRTDNARVNIDASLRDQIWQTIQAWAHSIEIADLDRSELITRTSLSNTMEKPMCHFPMLFKRWPRKFETTRP